MWNGYLRMSIILFAILAVSFLYFDLVLQFSNTYWWWDSYEHYLGGIVVGFFALWLGTLRFNRRISLSHTVAFLLVIGITWELMEIVYPLGDSRFFSYAVDTSKDIILDALGAITAWYWSKRMRIKI